MIPCEIPFLFRLSIYPLSKYHTIALLDVISQIFLSLITPEERKLLSRVRNGLELLSHTTDWGFFWLVFICEGMET